MWNTCTNLADFVLPYMTEGNGFPVNFLIQLFLFLLPLQVRSLAAESDRAYQGGPLEHMFYQEASENLEKGAVDSDLADFPLPSQYTRMLDWFAVDLEGEHSAMDGQILEEHTRYVVYAIHRVLPIIIFKILEGYSKFDVCTNSRNGCF